MSADEADVRDLDEMPSMPGETKCIHLAGDARVCRIGAVLGSSLVGNAAVSAALLLIIFCVCF